MGDVGFRMGGFERGGDVVDGGAGGGRGQQPMFGATDRMGLGAPAADEERTLRPPFRFEVVEAAGTAMGEPDRHRGRVEPGEAGGGMERQPEACEAGGARRDRPRRSERGPVRGAMRLDPQPVEPGDVGKVRQFPGPGLARQEGGEARAVLREHG